MWSKINQWYSRKIFKWCDIGIYNDICQETNHLQVGSLKSEDEDMATWKDYLKDIYYNPKHPATLSGPTKLHKVLNNVGRYNIGVHKIRQWLQEQDSYSLQQQTKRKFKRNRVISDGIDALWDVDLADVSNLTKYNDNIKFLLIAIYVFSRYIEG